MPKKLLIWTACIFVGLSGALAAEPSVGGTTEDGRIFLLRQPDENYWNDWTAKHLLGEPGGQVDVYIWGEGKTVAFEGALSINCESASGYFWKNGSLWGEPATERDFNAEVPLDVIANARRIFC